MSRSKDSEVRPRLMSPEAPKKPESFTRSQLPADVQELMRTRYKIAKATKEAYWADRKS
jgi:hypothetical protein